MENYKTITIDCTESTNTYAAGLSADPSDLTPVVVTTDNQTCGRGQRGNSWESEPGKNLTFSLVLYPHWLAPSHQFELSMLVSVGIVNALRPYVDNPAWLKIKWPNDIYYGDKKLAGILIENTIGQNRIERSIVGIGLNVNQEKFHSDAPNPVALCHIAGHEVNKEQVLDSVVENILDMTDRYAQDPELDQLMDLYDRLLWRNDGAFHLWRRPDGTEFEAMLVGVDADGRLHLRQPDGEQNTYLFKEVLAVL